MKKKILLITLIGLLILTGCESEKKEEIKQVVETNGMLSHTIDGAVAKEKTTKEDGYKTLCLEILKLNCNDDLGIKYVLLGIYAYQEDEEEFLKIKETIHEDSVETLLPFLILFYKLDKMNKFREVLLKLNIISKEFIPFFKSYLANCNDEELIEDNFSDYLLLTMNNINFLINATPGIVFYIGNINE